MNTFDNWFNPGPFMPHGGCYLWTKSLIALHVTSDTLITLAYYSIPFTLLYFVRRRRDLKFNWMFVCFAVFILACGTTHLMEVWNIWHADYWLSGIIKAVTALASVPTAVLLARLVPEALRLPSPAALEAANAALAREIAERQRAEDAVRRLNGELEQRVQERTQQLADANLELQNEIAGRWQAQLALNQSQQLLQAISDNSPAVIYAKDLAGRYLLVNRRYSELFHVPSDAVVGKTDHDIFPPAVAGAFQAMDQRVVAANTALMEEEIAPHDDGPHTYLSVKCPLRNQDGRPYAVFGISTDITERKAAIAEIARLNAELEQRVARRTAELAAANQELEAFSYSVSHDLRAPLRAVNGFAGIVLEDFGPHLPPDGRQFLVRIRDAGRRMGQLIDDLLTFARLSRQPVHRQTVDMAGLVRGALDDLKPPPEGRQIEFQIGDLPPCQGDPALLEHVWTNLLGNAVKYTRDRKPAVIEVGANGNNGETVYFVRDNGTGFDMQYADKLFQVFQRLHRADEFEGTGVGLAIVQRIVHRHGGRTWAKAEPDRGATFYFTLETPSP